jgi:hypothetical protein
VLLFENDLPNFDAFRVECCGGMCCGIPGKPNEEQIQYIRHLVLQDRRLRPETVAVTEKILLYFEAENMCFLAMTGCTLFCLFLFLSILMGVITEAGGEAAAIFIVFAVIGLLLWLFGVGRQCKRKIEINRDLARLGARPSA